MNIAIASGKGGTGKTTLAVNLVWHLARQNQLVGLYDCDVEAPNDNLFVKITDEELEELTVKQNKPAWNKESCKGCGKCAEACHYKALSKIGNMILNFPEMCHSCGTCEYICESGGITMKPYAVGKLYLREATIPFRFCSGLLNIGETAAPALVKAVKKQMQREAVNIIDSAPGTACQVVEALKNCDVAVLVTEPTPFGLSDLKLVAALTGKMNIPTGIVINRSGEGDEQIEQFARQYSIPIIGKIPFKREYAEYYSKGGILVEKFPEVDRLMAEIYDGINNLSAIPAINGKPFFTSVGKTDIEAEFTQGQYNDFTEFAVISGKGGTGKTTFTSALAALAGENTVFADCDVDAANLHLLLAPEILSGEMFSGGITAVIDQEKCINCGQCAKHCKFDAISTDETGNYRVDPASCEGCGLCVHVCPVQAVREEKADTGSWHISKTAYGPLVHARLNVGSENSGKLVSQVKTNAAQLAKNLKYKTVINDGPPGSGCPVIATLAGVDNVIIVTEPTVSGVHDLERVLKLAKYFDLKTSVVVNKADLNPAMKNAIIELTVKYDAEFLGDIPFDPNVNSALAAGKNIIAHGQGTAREAILNIWQKIEPQLTRKG